MPSLQFGSQDIGSFSLSTTSVLLLAFVVAPITLILGNAVYNLYFHPLRKYPGPFLARATKFYWIVHFYRGTHAHWAHKAHEKYGEIVRLSPNDISYVTPQAWKDIYGHRHGAQENMKDQRAMIRDDLSHDSIITADRAKHAQLRKLLSNAFSDKSMREQEPIIRHYVDMLISRLQSNCDDGRKPLNMLSWYNFTTFDIIGHLSFDESFDCLLHSDYHPWVLYTFSAIEATIKFNAINRIVPLGRINRWLKQHVVPREILSDRAANNQLVTAKVERRKTRFPTYTDFMTHLIQAEEKGALAPGELDMTARVLIIAGSETTATLLTGITYLLLTHSPALQRLKDEIRSRFATAEDISINTVNDLPFLLACLDEALRMYPPAAGSLQRTTPPEGALICGDWLPGQTTVSINFFANGRASQNWEDPESFRPERFMVGEKGKVWNDRREALQPFSFGPRNCIGRNLAYVEMRLILAKVLWTFDLELEDGNEDPTKQHIFGVWEKKPLMVRLTPVKR